MGALILERLKIGRGVTVAAGSVVKGNIPDHVLVGGSPAVIIKRGIEPH
jgi:acetyltransferase-like isoleucine patch superfamily enzyme